MLQALLHAKIIIILVVEDFFDRNNEIEVCGKTAYLLRTELFRSLGAYTQ